MSIPMTDSNQAAWRPDSDTIESANVTAAMRERGLSSYDDLHRWSIDDRGAFWSMVVERLGIVFDVPPERIVAGPPRDPTWLPGARLNIVDSCFTAPGDKTAVVARRFAAIL